MSFKSIITVLTLISMFAVPMFFIDLLQVYDLTTIIVVSVFEFCSLVILLIINKKKDTTKKYPKVLEYLLNPTAEYKDIPTNKKLDNEIDLLSFYLEHVYPLLKSIIRKKLFILLRYRWKPILLKLVFFGAFVYTVYFAWVKAITPRYITKQQTEFVSKIHDDMLKKLSSENILFMQTISLLESTGNSKAINGQYIGLYQMGHDALKDVGLADLPKDIFLNDPIIQNWAMNEYMKINYKRLLPYIVKYKIPYSNGIRIGHNIVTVSGLLAAAHLVGAGGVKRFIESNGKDVAADGNGVPLTHYLQLNNFNIKMK